jgi:DNA polymerase III epsilon subunit-like protein
MRAYQIIPLSNTLTESILQQLDQLIASDITLILDDAIIAELYIRQLSKQQEAAPFAKDVKNSYADTLESLEKFELFVSSNDQLKSELAFLTMEYKELEPEELRNRLRLTRNGLCNLLNKYKISF